MIDTDYILFTHLCIFLKDASYMALFGIDKKIDAKLLK